jgi:hypothetical protein
LVTLKKKGYGFRLKWKKLQGLHHWNIDKYKGEFQKARLQILKSDDITEDVVYWDLKVIRYGSGKCEIKVYSMILFSNCFTW